MCEQFFIFDNIFQIHEHIEIDKVSQIGNFLNSQILFKFARFFSNSQAFFELVDIFKIKHISSNLHIFLIL